MIKLKLIQNLDNTHQKGENEKTFSAFNTPPPQKNPLKLFELCDVFLTCLNNVQIKGRKSAKKMSLSSLHHHHQPEPLIQGRTHPAFHAVDTNF